MSKFVGLMPTIIKKQRKIMPIQGYTVINNSAQVACGSCVDLMRAIPDGSVDLVLTDPPYNLGLFMKERGTNMEKTKAEPFCIPRLGRPRFQNVV
jgi:site-specific DNA-methyltransferase (adenine-specific)/modification methylase